MTEKQLEKNNEELLYNQLYKKTKDCGRTQFVRLLLDKERENTELKEEFDRMFAVYHSRKLIKKFNDKYDEEDKMKNPNRDYACIYPDAEEVYKRYYELKEQLQQKEDIINKAKKYIKNNSHKTEWGDLEQDNESIDINDDVTDTEFITDLIEILDNKGE